MTTYKLCKKKVCIEYPLGSILLLSMFAFGIRRAHGTPKDIALSISLIGIPLIIEFIRLIRSKWEVRIGYAHIEIDDERSHKPKLIDYSNIKEIQSKWRAVVILLNKVQSGTRRVTLDFSVTKNGRRAKDELVNNWKQYRLEQT